MRCCCRFKIVPRITLRGRLHIFTYRASFCRRRRDAAAAAEAAELERAVAAAEAARSEAQVKALTISIYIVVMLPAEVVVSKTCMPLNIAWPAFECAQLATAIDTSD